MNRADALPAIWYDQDCRAIHHSFCPSTQFRAFAHIQTGLVPCRKRLKLISKPD